MIDNKVILQAVCRGRINIRICNLHKTQTLLPATGKKITKEF